MTDRTRNRGMRSLTAALNPVVRPLFRARGTVTADIVAHWRVIAGETIAGHAVPERYVPDRRGGGTLHLRVAAGWAPDIDYLSAQIIDRINGFLGYRAVSRLTIVQGALKAPAAAPQAARNVELGGAAPDDGRLAAIDDSGLRRALAKLASAVSRGKSRGSKT